MFQEALMYPFGIWIATLLACIKVVFWVWLAYDFRLISVLRFSDKSLKGVRLCNESFRFYNFFALNDVGTLSFHVNAFFGNFGVFRKKNMKKREVIVSLCTYIVDENVSKNCWWSVLEQVFEN